MDHEVTILMSPAKAFLPSQREVIALAEKLFARGEAADARKLLEDAIEILDPTPDLITAAAFFTMRDPALAVRQRLAAVLKLSPAPAAEIPDWFQSVRVAALVYLAEETRSVNDWEEAYAVSSEFLKTRKDQASLLTYHYICHSLISSY